MSADIELDQIKAKVRALENRLEEQDAAREKTSDELEAWRKVLEFHEPPRRRTIIRRTGKPVLRERILAVMMDPDSPRRMRAADVIAALELKGWMPNGENAEQIVRNRLGMLHRDRQLRRSGYGTYSLPHGEAT
jgi:hypothetical protein